MERRRTRSSASVVADSPGVVPVRQAKRRRAEDIGSEAGPSSAGEDVVTPDAMASALCNYTSWKANVRNVNRAGYPGISLPEGHEILEHCYQREMDSILASVSARIAEKAGNLERPSPEKYISRLLGRFGKLGAKRSIFWGELARNVAEAGIYDGIACAPLPLVTRCTEASLEAALASATAEQTRLTVALGVTTAENASLRAERDEAQSQRDQAQLQRDQAQLQRDQAQVERDQAQACTQCAICLSEPKRVLFLPCKHINCCAGCAPDQVRCPLCREPIVATTEVFF